MFLSFWFYNCFGLEFCSYENVQLGTKDGMGSKSCLVDGFGTRIKCKAHLIEPVAVKIYFKRA